LHINKNAELSQQRAFHLKLESSCNSQRLDDPLAICEKLDDIVTRLNILTMPFEPLSTENDTLFSKLPPEVFVQIANIVNHQRLKPKDSLSREEYISELTKPLNYIKQYNIAYYIQIDNEVRENLEYKYVRNYMKRQSKYLLRNFISDLKKANIELSVGIQELIKKVFPATYRASCIL
jgi:hypothetical protein